VAITAQRLVAQGAPSAFALCRPPGHHAGSDFYGGYCFFNNAAIAAQAFIDNGARRVAVLDVDFHHGNGTQEIFYRRNDVLFCSLHGHPEDEYPYFSGYEDETGEGAGDGFNANFPLRPGTAWAQYRPALAAALKRIDAYGADALVISLGVDTYENDPISSFKLKCEDYLRLGEMIAGAGRPTLFVMEGGYAVEEIGINTVNVLTGFESAR
jgi:acetoin utilization deacetylase AcuC-like enzyme